MIFGPGGQPDHLTFAGLRGGGKGGKPQTTESTSTTQLPQWLDDASQNAVQTATDLSQRPYTPYGGQIVADTPADTSQAYQQVRDMQGQYDPAYQSAAAAQQGVLGNLQSLTPGAQNAVTNQLYGNYQQNVMNPAQGMLGGYLQGGPLTAQGVLSNAQQLMSPYDAAVLNPALQLGQQQLAQNLQTIGAGANQAGAFGGTRQGVQEGVAQSQAALGAGQYLGNLLNTQWNNSLNTGYNIGALGAGQGLTAAQALAGMGQTGYANAQQGAQNMMGTNLQLGETAAQQLPQVATAQQAADQKNASLLQTTGAAQQQQQQNLLNSQMGQFYEQQDWPVQNLDILLSSLGAVPYGSTTSGTQTGTTPQRNVGAGVLGGAASAAMIGNMLMPGGLGAGIGAAAGGILGAL
jgi:hypothetical protein